MQKYPSQWTAKPFHPIAEIAVKNNRQARRIALWIILGVVWFIMSLALLIPYIEDLETERIQRTTAYVIGLTNNNIGISGPLIVTAKPWTPTPAIETATESTP